MIKNNRRIIIYTCMIFLLTTIGAGAAPKADLWQVWEDFDSEKPADDLHAPWHDFLGKYVVVDPDGINLVWYGQVSGKDRETLDKYIETLAALPVTDLSRAEQLAYWINLYNSLTIRLILEHYPVASIRDIDISPGFFADGPWDKKLVRIEGRQVSLNDIEHRILRPIWKDPRIHYAVNCASLGCPDLQPVAFTAANTLELFDKGAGDYINHRRGVTFRDGRLIVSSIYEWFKDDFGGSDAGVIRHVRKYARPALGEKLKKADHIADDRYDWSLNGAE